MMMLNLLNHQNTQIIQQKIIINTYLPEHTIFLKHHKKNFRKMVINVPRFLEIHGP